MRPRAKSLTLAIFGAASLALLATQPALADPPPWAGRWSHPNKHYHDRDDARFFGGRCSSIAGRIGFNQRKIVEITPTGRHRRALQWYRDDLANARRDLYRCRNGSYYNAGDRDFDFDDDRFYEPSYDRRFRWKEDWPFFLGTFLQSQER